MNKARRYANLMPAVIAKSCNKLLNGKTYWKSAALPAILHGSEVVCYTFFKFFLCKPDNQITDRRKQSIEIHSKCKKMYCYKRIKGGRWIITSSNQRHEDKILFIKHILRDNNLLKEIFLQQYDNKKCTKWITQIKKYMEILQINIHMIETYRVMTIKKMIKNYDNKQWHENLQNKSTLKLYRKFKFTIQDEQKLYDNTACF